MKKFLPLLFVLVLTGAGCSTSSAPKNTNADGGVYRSADAGKNWLQASAVPTAKGVGTLSTANILTMERDPGDVSMLYLTTRDDGFLYSEDGGVTWHQPRDKNLNTGYVSSVKVDPKNVCTVYASKGSRLYKSVNCMRTFQNDTYIESRAKVEVSKIAVDWFNPQTVWIGLSNGDVQKSTDGGKTWRNSTHVKGAIVDMMINLKDSRVLLVATETSGIMKTTDGGETWTNVTSKELSGADVVYDVIQSNDSGVVVAATKYGLIRSGDFGVTWQGIQLVTAPGQVQIRAVGMDGAKPNVLYYATAGTMYRSTDGGSAWQTSKLPSQRTPRAILVDPSNNAVLYVGVASEVK